MRSETLLEISSIFTMPTRRPMPIRPYTVLQLAIFMYLFLRAIFVFRVLRYSSTLRTASPLRILRRWSLLSLVLLVGSLDELQ